MGLEELFLPKRLVRENFQSRRGLVMPLVIVYSDSGVHGLSAQGCHNAHTREWSLSFLTSSARAVGAEEMRSAFRRLFSRLPSAFYGHTRQFLQRCFCGCFTVEILCHPHSVGSVVLWKASSGLLQVNEMDKSRRRQLLALLQVRWCIAGLATTPAYQTGLQYVVCQGVLHANRVLDWHLAMPIPSASIAGVVSPTLRAHAATSTAALDSRSAAWRWAPGSLVHAVTAVRGWHCNLRVDFCALYTKGLPHRPFALAIALITHTFLWISSHYR